MSATPHIFTDERHVWTDEQFREAVAVIEHMRARQLRHHAAALMECARVNADRGLHHSAAREQATACAYLDLAHDLDGEGLLW